MWRRLSLRERWENDVEGRQALEEESWPRNELFGQSWILMGLLFK